MCTDWFLLPSRPKSSGCRSLFLTWVWFSSCCVCFDACPQLVFLLVMSSIARQGRLSCMGPFHLTRQFSMGMSFRLSAWASFLYLRILHSKSCWLFEELSWRNSPIYVTLTDVRAALIIWQSLKSVWTTTQESLIWFDLIWFEFDVSRSKASIEKWTNGQSETAYISYRKMFEEKEPDGLAVYWLTSGVDPDARLA